MNRYNSTIKQKTCKGGCGKYPKIGFKGFCGEICLSKGRVRESQGEGKESGRKVQKNSFGGISIQLADAVFGKWVKNRDADASKNIICPCCEKKFNLQDKTNDGGFVVQPLHFVKRSVYSLRWDEFNVNAGCCYCNFDMFIEPKGKDYQGYRKFLVNKIGEEKVAEMELEERKINKLDKSLIQEVILKYKKP